MGCACLKSDIIVTNNKMKKTETNNSRKHLVVDSNIQSSPDHNVIENIQRLGSGHHRVASSRENNSNLNNRGDQGHHNTENRNSHIQVNINVNHFSNQNNEINRRPINEGIRTFNFGGPEPYLQSKNDPCFNFTEIPNEYVGSGLKRIPAFVSNISNEDLIKKRDAFWGTRTEGKPETWEFLRNICTNKELEDYLLIDFLEAAGVSPYKECINITYDTGGAIYEIPNYCINDPSKYDLTFHHKSKPAENFLILTVRNIIDEKDIKVSNLHSIKDIKQTIITSFPFKEDNMTLERIRLFFGGKELKDHEEVWDHLYLESGSKLIMMCKPVIVD